MLEASYANTARLLLLLVLFNLSVPLSLAKDESSSSGISVFPSITKLDLESDPPEYSLTYQNNTNSEVNLELSAQDFTELEDGWKVNFLEPKDAQNYHYSLSSWIDFDKKALSLNPNESAQVKVYITQDKLTPGGHYGSILAQINQKSGIPSQVRIKGVLSSLVFVRTNTGKETEAAEISSFQPKQSFFSFPEGFVLRFKNSGNVELIPFGLVEVKDAFGTVVAKGILNQDSLITLPESIRRYDIALEEQPGLLFWPGFYSAQIIVHYGKTQKELISQTRFFSRGSNQTQALIIALLLLSVGGSLVFRRIN